MTLLHRIQGHWILAVGAIAGCLAVVAGAFGAHALQGALSPRAQGWYDTAVSYHTTHALAIIACALAWQQGARVNSIWFALSSLSFMAGLLLFSGSLYLMAFTGQTRLGMVTPVGGVFLIIGWISLAIAVIKR